MSALTAVASVQARIASIESRFGAIPAPLPDTTIATTPSIGQTAAFGTEPVADTAFTEVFARALGTGSATAAPATNPFGGSTTSTTNTTNTTVPAGTPFAEEFVAAGQRHGISPTILAAVGFVESSYRTDAVSPAGAIGLMQLMPATAASLGVDPTDPSSAIDGAARLLSDFRDRFGSIELALAAYNVGPGTISNAGGITPGSQAERYVTKVLATEQGMR
jgi:soluble lytic murein transglycosylase-like protein